MRAENILLKDKIRKTSFDQIRLENNDEKVNTLTVIPSSPLLITIFDAITNCLKTKSNLSPVQLYMLTLIRLRVTFSVGFLAYCFYVDLTTASKLFKHYIDVIVTYCTHVSSLVSRPDRDVPRLSLQYSFRNA